MDDFKSTPPNDSDLSLQDFFDGNLGFLIGKAHRRLRRNWQLSLRSIGTTTAEGAAISLLAINSSVSQREASRMLEIDVMAVRRVLKSLVEKHLATEGTDLKDPRKFCYTLTEEGKSLSETITRMADTHKRDLLNLLGQPAIAQMTSCLQHIIEEYPIAELPANKPFIA